MLFCFPQVYCGFKPREVPRCYFVVVRAFCVDQARCRFAIVTARSMFRMLSRTSRSMPGA